MICSERGQKVLKLSHVNPCKSRPNDPPASVVLKLQQVVRLFKMLGEIRTAVWEEAEFEAHVGRCTYLRLDPGTPQQLDIRDHFYLKGFQDTDPLPTRRGVRIYGLEVEDFIDLLRDDVATAWPEVLTTQACHESSDHEDAAECYFCNPRIAGSYKLYLKCNLLSEIVN